MLMSFNVFRSLVLQVIMRCFRLEITLKVWYKRIWYFRVELWILHAREIVHVSHALKIRDALFKEKQRKGAFTSTQV